MANTLPDSFLFQYASDRRLHVRMDRPSVVGMAQAVTEPVICIDGFFGRVASSIAESGKHAIEKKYTGNRIKICGHKVHYHGKQEPEDICWALSKFHRQFPKNDPRYNLSFGANLLDIDNVTDSWDVDVVVTTSHTTSTYPYNEHKRRVTVQFLELYFRPSINGLR